MTATLNLKVVKARQQKTWASGNDAAVAARIHPMSEGLVDVADLATGIHILDVATGTGNAPSQQLAAVVS